MIKQSTQSGFTAVELLITLFVAVAFLVAGYQLFNVVVKDGGQARAESRAGNVAYDYMRRYAPNATNPCTTSTPLNNSALNIDGLSNARITVTITCPDVTTASLSKIEVVLTFNSPATTVKYSTFLNSSSAQVADVTDGLIAWWKLNGNTNASIGTVDGIGSNLTPTTGQNGQANGAYTFSGTNSNINLPSTFSLGVTNVSLSMWVNSATATNSGAFMKISGSGYGIGMGSTSFDNSAPGTKLVMLYEGVRWIATTKDVGTGWHHIVMVIGADGVPSAYEDGVLVGSYPGGNATMGSNPTLIGAGNSSNSRNFNGSMDDIRIYNRVLSATEISSLYSGGAK